LARDVTDYNLYTQITSQPADLERVLTAEEPVPAAAELLGRAKRVFTIGTGTSTNAAKTAAFMLRAAGLDAVEWAAYDFASFGPALRDGDAAIVFSHSGRKRYSRDTLARLHDAKTPTVWVASTAAEPNEADVILRTVPRETSSAFTVSHTTAMLLTARVADRVSARCLGELEAVPPAVREAVALRDQVAELARSWHPFENLIGVGAGPHEVSGHELAIKVAEAARMRCKGYAAEQFLHGPQAQVQAGDPLVVFSGSGPSLERSITVAQFGLDAGLPTAWVAPVQGPAGSTWLRVPDVGEQLAPIVEIIPGQWLAAHLAVLQDVNADNFRMDEFGEFYKKYSL
jgi:glucosamine--fructose-6-phosphate aminotransferase (isomerizing)